MINNFSIFKNDYKDKEGQPDYNISHKPVDAEKGFNIGAVWKKETSAGKPFLSCKLDEEKVYKKEDGTEGKRTGYVIITQDEYNALTGGKKPLEATTEAPKGTSGEITQEDIDSIPF